MLEIEYLASPYSHPDPKVRQWRYEQALKTVVRLMQEGRKVYSPIVYSHPLVSNGAPDDRPFWEEMDIPILDISKNLIVLKLPGWKESIGVGDEIFESATVRRPIEYIELLSEN